MLLVARQDFIFGQMAITVDIDSLEDLIEVLLLVIEREMSGDECKNCLFNF